MTGISACNNGTSEDDGSIDVIEETIPAPDTTPPVITLLGTTPVSIELGTPYLDAGATALDDTDGVVAVTTGNPVDVNLVGTYTVTYDAVDATGNAATQVTRTVNVTPDATPPVISLVGTTPISFALGIPYVDAGATALHNIDDPLAVTTVNPVDVNLAGTYTVTYDAVDAAGNNAVQVTRTVTVTVIPDTTPPVITLLGATSVNIELGTPYVDAGANALDNFDGVVGVTTNNPVDVNTVGSYTVTYDATDTAGNAAVQVIRTVNVTPDVTPPVITLTGPTSVDIELGTPYVDAGATALDNIDGAVAVTTVNPVDENTLGSYTVTYDAVDTAANAAVQVIRTVNVNPVSIFELTDPTPGAGDQFGQLVVILANGNIAVSDPYDSSIAANNGAVHLYDSVTKTRIASIYGDEAGDQIGFGSITALANGNFVIASPVDTVGGLAAAGSVRLVDGATGVEVPGSLVAGNNPGDGIGLGGITALANSSYVIASWFDTVASQPLAGSVQLIDGTTGIQIGSTITGDNLFDSVGSGGVTALTNGNFVITSPSDDVGLIDNGSVRLVNGSGADVAGGLIAGDNSGDALGPGGVIALTNGNYVIGSPSDNAGNGSVRLVDGATGAEIPGGLIVGDNAGDSLGFVTALANGNYVISAPADDVGAVDTGSVRLVNGVTGVEIPGGLITGDTVNDQLGFGDTIALANNNFVVASIFDDEGFTDNGSVRLASGTSGLQINMIAGENPGDQLGLSVNGITALANNNFVIASQLDDAGLTDNGTVRLVDGTTGNPVVGGTIAGAAADDQLGSDGVFALVSNNYVVVSSLDDEAGLDLGTVRLVDGSTGTQIGASITGSSANDLNLATVTGSPAGDYYILSMSFADKDALTDSGLVRLIVP